MSRRHARLVWREDSWWLEDLESTNGTFVGEFAAAQRLAAPVRLEPGQVFRVGLARFRLCGQSAESEPLRASARRSL